MRERFAYSQEEVIGLKRSAKTFSLGSVCSESKRFSSLERIFFHFSGSE